MTSTTWDFAAGFKHLEDVQIQTMQGGAGNQEWISATPDACRNTALAAMFVAEGMLYAMGKKPIPSDQSFPGALLVAVSPIGLAMPMAAPGTPITLGDGLGFLTPSDRSWPSSGTLTLGQQVAIYQLAMRRAVRELVREARTFSAGTVPMLDDDNRTGTPAGPPAPGLPNVGAVPAGILVVVAVLGVAALAAAAWTAVESVKPVCAMSVQKAAIAAQLTFDSQLAVSQIKAGLPVTVSQLAKTYAENERYEGTAVPVAVGAAALVAGAVAAWQWSKRRKAAGTSAQMVKL